MSHTGNGDSGGVVERSPKPYPKALRVQARMMHEVDSMTYKEIAVELNLPSWKTIAKWSASEGWKKGDLATLAQDAAMESRLALARRMGLGVQDQMVKAKELMDATKEEQSVVQQPDSKDPVVVSRDVPDYKIQNEGLKRAMELTGTKIERTEHEHKHSGDIVHKYHLPEKKKLTTPEYQVENGAD